MINTCQTVLVESDYTEPFEDRIDILFRELELATKWQRPSVLLAIYSTECVHGDAELALENRLLDLGQKAHHIIVKNQEDADIPLLISELADLNDVVVFVEGLGWGGGEDDFNAYRALNNHREFFIENQVRVVFWLTESEAIDLAHYAPDYWAFRHRVIEFVDSPRSEQVSPHVLESVWQDVGEFTDTSSDDLDAKIALRSALLTDLPDGNESTAARANLLLTLGILHWRRGDYEQATQFLNTTLDLAGKLQDHCLQGLCFNAIALVKTALGRTEEAIQAYQHALGLAPERISPWNNLGNLYSKLEKYEEALTAFQKAIEQNPSDLVSWNGLGNAYYKLGRNDDALYAFLKDVELNPQHAHSWCSLGDVYANEGQLDDALAAYQKALEIDRRTINSWIGLGDVYRMQGSNENAILAYQTAIEIDPKSAQAWNELGNLYYNSGANNEGVLAYCKAIELDPDNEQSYNNLALIYIQKGDYAKAIPLLQKEIELLDDAADKALLWNQLGDAYRKLDDYDSAVAAYRKADELDPKNAAPQTTQSTVESDLSTAIPTNDDSITPILNLEFEINPEELLIREPAGSVLVTTPEDIQAADDTDPPTIESEIDFAKWLEELVMPLPIPAHPEETSAIGMASDEVEQPDEIGIVPATVSDLSNGTEGSEPEIACQEFETDATTDSTGTETLSSVGTDPATLGLVSDNYGSLFLEEADPENTPPVVTAVTDGSSVKADVTQNEIANPPQAEIDAKTAQIWNELGNIYYNIVAYDDAINALNKAIDLDPSYGWTYNNLASIYIHKGHYSEAIPILQRGIKLLGGAKDRALLWNRLGDAYRRLDQPDKAAAA
jgi:tetratricopeptide (TPR) repeat protein